jgi:hypothetical protein
MPFYIPALVSKFECIGNTLSTFNISFSNLDTNLYNLSNYTVNSVNFLSSTMVSVSSTLKSNINFLSSTMVSVSSNLKSNINFLSSTTIAVSSSLQNNINFLSSNMISVSSNLQNQINLSSFVISEYIKQGTLVCPRDGQSINWSVTANGRNASMNLSANVRMNNPTDLIAGESGNLVVNIQTAGKAITSFGNIWNFVNDFSSLNTALSTKNVISYYFDGTQMLSNLLIF